MLLLAAQQWLTHHLEERQLLAAQERTTAVADGVINGMNTLMDIEVGGKSVIGDAAGRALFIKRLGVSDNIKELRVVRAKGTNDEYGEGLPEQKPVDEMDHAVLASGKRQFKMTEDSQGNASLRLVLPFIAMKEFRASKCLECHGVDEGTVLGLVSVTMDIKDDVADLRMVKTWIWAGQVILQVVLFFVIGMIVRRSLSQLGAEPAEAANLAQRVAHGDLSQPIELRAGDKRSMMAQGRSRHGAGGSGRHHHAGSGQQHSPPDRYHGRNHGGKRRTKHRRVTGRRGHPANGPSHTTKCRAGGRNGRRRPKPER